MANSHPHVELFRKLSRYPLGKWLFSRVVCWRAPYFYSIRPLFTDLRIGYSQVHVKKRRRVHNHIGTVHAIAMANACELAAGVVTEVSVPKSMRWIPKGMSINYLRKAETSILATATYEADLDETTAADVVIPVKVTDTQGNVVVSADITMYVTPKPPK